MAGRNIGENYVMDNSGMMSILQRGIDRSVAEAKAKATQRQSDIEDLSKQINKLSPKGLATQDIPSFNKKMEELKDAYYKYRSAGNDSDMRQTRMEVDNKWRETFDYATTASDRRAKLIPIAAHYAQHPEMYDDNAIKDVAKEIAKPIDEVDFTRIDPLSRERKVDHTKVNDAIYKDIKGLLDGTAVDTKTVNLPGKAGMKGRTIINNEREVDPKSLATVIQNHYRGSDDFKKMLNDSYGKETDDPIKQMAMYQQDLPKEIYTKYDKPQVQTNQPIVIKTGGSGKGKGDSATDQARLYTQQQVHGVLNGDKAAIERLVGVVNGLGQYSDAEHKNLNISKKGNRLIVDIPAMKKGAGENAATSSFERHIIDTSTDRGRQEFAAIYQKLTGEKVAPSIVNTFKGKKLVSTKAPAVDLGGDKKAVTTSNKAAKSGTTTGKRKKSIPGF